MERKIANLEASLVYAQADLHKAHQEIAKWKDLYYSLKSNMVSIPVLPLGPEYPQVYHIC